MTIVTETRVQENSRVMALRAKHAELSRKVEDEQKTLSSPDYYLRHLKKQKLLLKEELIDEERRKVS